MPLPGHFPINRLDSDCIRMRVHDRVPTPAHADVIFDYMIKRHWGFREINDVLDLLLAAWARGEDHDFDTDW